MMAKTRPLVLAHLPLPMGAVTDGGFLQGNFIKPAFYGFAFRALILWELALLLRPSNAQIVFFPTVQWLSEGVSNSSIQISWLALGYLKHFQRGSQ